MSLFKEVYTVQSMIVVNLLYVTLSRSTYRRCKVQTSYLQNAHFEKNAKNLFKYLLYMYYKSNTVLTTRLNTSNLVMHYSSFGTPAVGSIL